MTIPKLALTFEKAAEACGYSVRTLKYQVAAGNLRARYANSKGVIRVEDLAQWLDDLPAEPQAGHRPVMLEDEMGVTTTDAPSGAGNSGPLISNDGLGTTNPTSKPLFRTPERDTPTAEEYERDRRQRRYSIVSVGRQ